MFHSSPLTASKRRNSSSWHDSFLLSTTSLGLIDQNDHHYMYRNDALNFLQLFIFALTNVCTVKPAQLHYLIRYNSAQVMAVLSAVLFLLQHDDKFITYRAMYIPLQSSRTKKKRDAHVTAL